MTTEAAVDTAALDAWLAKHLFGCGTRYGPCPTKAHRDLSTTGDGMLMVLEAMRERGWDFTLNSWPDDAPPYEALFERRSDALTGGVRSAEDLPTAVALAARAALEAEA